METLQRTANRGSISTGFDIDNSLKFEPDNSEYLGKTPTSSGNRRTFTISMWIKRTELGMDCYLMEAGDGDYNQSDRTLIKFDSSDNFRFGGGSAYQRTTNRVFRDTSAWYHIVMAVDTTDSTAANRLKLYVNGVEETSFGTSSDPSQNFEYAFCKDDEHTVGYNHTDNGAYYGGYMSEVILIDGQQLDPTSFGEFDEDTGIWKPIDVSGLSFGTNGFYLDFKDASNLGNDASGGTDFTLNNITAADQATDTPTNSFSTWNVLPLYNGTIFSFPNGATEVKRTSGTGWTTAYSSMGANKGKWYAEFQILTSGNYLMNGNVPLAKIQSVSATQFYLGSEANAAAGAGYYSSGTTNNDYIYHDGGATDSGVTTSADDIISVAMDCDNNKVHFAVNGTWTNSSNPANNTNGFTMTDDYQFFAHATLTGDQTWKNNFGGYTTISISSGASDANGYGTFEYAPPSGYYALCTKNLAEYG